MKYYSNDDVSMRVITNHDLQLLATHRNEQSTWRNLTSGMPVQLHRQKQWLEGLSNNDLYFIATIDDEDVALLRCTDIDWQNSTGCVGLDVFEPWRGKGYASRCFKLIVEFAFKELNLHRLWLLVLESNLKAIAVYEKAGFQYEGAMREHIFRDGKYNNYILMGVLRGEWNG